jgi:ATP-dependent DNA helicase PIF1
MPLKLLSEKVVTDKLTNDQKKAFELMMRGENVFITGAGGTGKSFIIKAFRGCKPTRKMGICSTTGASALVIDGTTLHSFLGIGLGTGTVEYLVNKIRRNNMIRKRWMELQTLVIDEVSMLDPELLDKLNEAGKRLRKNTEPFGGIQLILTGDFLQLPPVSANTFLFEHDVWQEIVSHTVYLKEIVRQTDKTLIEVLNKVRVGNIDEQVEEILSSRLDAPIEIGDGILPTVLYSTNAEVDEINDDELEKLTDENDEMIYEYDMEVKIYHPKANKDWIIEKQIKNCPSPQTLRIAVGAQVMLTWNLDIDGGLVNGSRGVVTSFVDDIPIVRFLNGKEMPMKYNAWPLEEGKNTLLEVIQVPLRLAWSISIHKAQGLTLDCLLIDLGSIFTYGQAYVALSRSKSLEGLSISSLKFNRFYAHPKAVEYYEMLDGKTVEKKVKKGKCVKKVKKKVKKKTVSSEDD